MIILLFSSLETPRLGGCSQNLKIGVSCSFSSYQTGGVDLVYLKDIGGKIHLSGTMQSLFIVAVISV